MEVGWEKGEGRYDGGKVGKVVKGRKNGEKVGRVGKEGVGWERTW